VDGFWEKARNIAGVSSTTGVNLDELNKILCAVKFIEQKAVPLDWRINFQTEGHDCQPY
jgi:alkyl hydroperoxide reductase subunit AhpC